MKLNILLVVNAVIDIIIGIALVLVPGTVMGLYGLMSMEKGTEQVLGAMLIGFAVLNWFARTAEEWDSLRAILLANLASNAVSFVVLLYTELSGIWNPLGWTLVALNLVLALAYGYFLLNPSRSMANVH